MNSLILNRESFEMPADGWYQIAPVGEFPHSGAGVIQVVDRAACDAMVNAFRAETKKPNFAGLLIDFDHFSLDEKLKSEAAGWVIDLENRNSGLWGKIRWSDLGEDCVKGGRYRFISPVWSRSDCESVGSDPDSGQQKLRPVRLLNAAVTNDPNLKGMRPLSNRRSDAEGPATKSTQDTKQIGNASPAPEKRLKWVLGESDRKCPSCLALAGQVHTEADWDAAGLRPGAEKLYCKENCHCSLVETDDPVSGSLGDLPIRKGEVVNRQETMKNNWSDEARAASLAVRRAKAAARRALQDGGDKELAPDRPGGNGGDRPGDGDPAERKPAVEPIDWENQPLPIDDQYHILPYDPEKAFDDALKAIEDFKKEAEKAFEDAYGVKPVDPSDMELAEEMVAVPDEYRTGGVLSPRELAQKLAHHGEDVTVPKDSDGGNQGHQDLERSAQEKAAQEKQSRHDDGEGIHGMAESLMEREDAGEKLSAQEKAFLKQYREIIGDLDEVRRDAMGNREGSDLLNRAREAVQLAKARARSLKSRG